MLVEHQENKFDELLRRVPVVINLGVQDFAENLQTQGVQVVHVAWSPPAVADQATLDLLEKFL